MKIKKRNSLKSKQTINKRRQKPEDEMLRKMKPEKGYYSEFEPEPEPQPQLEQEPQPEPLSKEEIEKQKHEIYVREYLGYMSEMRKFQHHFRSDILEKRRRDFLERLKPKPVKVQQSDIPPEMTEVNYTEMTINELDTQHRMMAQHFKQRFASVYHSLQPQFRRLTVYVLMIKHNQRLIRRAPRKKPNPERIEFIKIAKEKEFEGEKIRKVTKVLNFD